MKMSSRVTPEYAYWAMSENSALLLDVRDESEFVALHAAGAVCMPSPARVNVWDRPLREERGGNGSIAPVCDRAMGRGGRGVARPRVPTARDDVARRVKRRGATRGERDEPPTEPGIEANICLSSRHGGTRGAGESAERTRVDIASLNLVQ